MGARFPRRLVLRPGFCFSLGPSVREARGDGAPVGAAVNRHAPVLPGHVRAPSGATSRRSRLGAGPRFLPQRGLSPGAATVSQLLAGGPLYPRAEPRRRPGAWVADHARGRRTDRGQDFPGAGHFEEVLHHALPPLGSSHLATPRESALIGRGEGTITYIRNIGQETRRRFFGEGRPGRQWFTIGERSGPGIQIALVGGAVKQAARREQSDNQEE